MSRENVEFVRCAYEAFGAGGVEAMMSDYWAADIVWDVSAMNIPGLGTHHGYEEVKSFFDDWFGAFPFESWEHDVERLVDAGDCIVATVTQRGRGTTSGAVAELHMGQVVTVRDGRIVRLDVYPDQKQALEVAGLSE